MTCYGDMSKRDKFNTCPYYNDRKYYRSKPILSKPCQRVFSYFLPPMIDYE